MFLEQSKVYWTAAESCSQLEDVAAEIVAEAVDRRETLNRRRELEAVKRRAAFKLITPKGLQQDYPTVPIGYEKAFFEALEKYQQEMSEIYPA